MFHVDHPYYPSPYFCPYLSVSHVYHHLCPYFYHCFLIFLSYHNMAYSTVKISTTTCKIQCLVQYIIHFKHSSLIVYLHVCNNNNNNGEYLYTCIVHFTMSQCALQSVEDFFGLHIMAPLAAKQLTQMYNHEI
jgi:hypothetical protein